MTEPTEDQLRQMENQGKQLIAMCRAHTQALMVKAMRAYMVSLEIPLSTTAMEANFSLELFPRVD